MADEHSQEGHEGQRRQDHPGDEGQVSSVDGGGVRPGDLLRSAIVELDLVPVNDKGRRVYNHVMGYDH